MNTNSSDISGVPFGKRTKLEDLSKYSVMNIPELVDSDISFQISELQEAEKAERQRQAAKKQRQEAERKRKEEKELIDKSKKINENTDTQLNNEFISTENGIKTRSEYLDIIRKSVRDNITLKFDNAIINLIVAADTITDETVLNNIKENIKFLVKFTRNFKERGDDVTEFIFKLLKTNTLSDKSYKNIEIYAKNEGIVLQNTETIKLLLKFHGITLDTPSIFKTNTNVVKQGGGLGRQYGGMWQRGGFFMTCS